MIAHEVVACGPRGAGGSAAVRPARPRLAWRAIKAFLDECESVQLMSDSAGTAVMLTAYRATQFDDDATARRIIAQTTERFGPPKVSVAHSEEFPSGKPVPGGYCQWNAPSERFAEFRDYVLAGDPWPKQVLGPVAVSFLYSFQWRDPDGHGPLVDQLSGHPTPDGQQRSMLGVTLQRKSYVSPGLWFPFAAEDPRLRDLLSFVIPILPFAVSPGHFSRATLNKAGTGYRFRRLDTEAVGLVDVISGKRK